MAKSIIIHLDDEAEARLEKLRRKTRTKNLQDMFRLICLAIDEQTELIEMGGSMYVKPPGHKSLVSYNPTLELEFEFSVPKKEPKGLVLQFQAHKDSKDTESD